MENLINELPSIKEKEWSYLEKIGVSHRETVMAEILRYFFDPNEAHGLGDKFIKALLKTKPKYLNSKEDISGSGYHKIQDEYYKVAQGFSEFNFAKSTTKSNVEVVTFNNNRIDIVINSDKLVIAIEFKINHHLDNPLDDYANFIKCQGQINGKGKSYNENEITSYRSDKYKEKEKYFVVLTPFWKSPTGKAVTNDNFVQIILADFIKNIKELIKNHWEDKKDTHQYHIYQDFINAIENRGRVVKFINKCSKIINTKTKNDNLEKLFQEKIKLTKLPKPYKKLKIIQENFENKTKTLIKKLNDNYKPLTATKDRIESGISKKVKNNIEYKIRLSLLGWNFEKWVNKVKIKDENIGDYFYTNEALTAKINILIG